MNYEKAKKRTTTWASIFVLIAFIVIVTIFLFTNDEEIHISSKTNNKINLLYCSVVNLENSFFSTEGAIKTLHEIKITFKNNAADKVSYIYSGDYPDANSTERAKSLASYRLGSYLSGKTPKSEELNPRYAIVKNSLHTIVNADKSLLTTLTAPIFYLDNETVENFKTYSSVDLKKYYEDHGFVCKIEDQ